MSQWRKVQYLRVCIGNLAVNIYANYCTRLFFFLPGESDLPLSEVQIDRKIKMKSELSVLGCCIQDSELQRHLCDGRLKPVDTVYRTIVFLKTCNDLQKTSLTKNILPSWIQWSVQLHPPPRRVIESKSCWTSTGLSVRKYSISSF